MKEPIENIVKEILFILQGMNSSIDGLEMDEEGRGCESTRRMRKEIDELIERMCGSGEDGEGES